MKLTYRMLVVVTVILSAIVGAASVLHYESTREPTRQEIERDAFLKFKDHKSNR